MTSSLLCAVFVGQWVCPCIRSPVLYRVAVRSFADRVPHVSSVPYNCKSSVNLVCVPLPSVCVEVSQL